MLLRGNKQEVGANDNKDENGKKVNGSDGPNGTLGLMAFDKPKFLGLAEVAAEKAPPYASGNWPKPPMTYVALNGEKTEDKPANAVRNYPEMLRKTPAFRWEHADRNLQVNAVALTKNAVLITYGVQKHDEKNKNRLIDDYSAWKVAALDRGDGHPLWECDLPCEPVLCSLAIDRAGRVIVTLRDGGVACIGSSN